MNILKKSFYLILCLYSTINIAQERFLIKNVTLFNGEKIIPNTSILIQDDKILKIGNNISKVTTIIDGTGKFLMPAMINAHVHAWSSVSLKQAAQSGVLNVLDMHGVEPMQKQMKSTNDSTNYARYYVAGYAATAPEGHGTQFGFPLPTLKEPKDAVSFVQGRVNAGVDYIKIIVEPWKPTISHETAKALIDEAHKHHKKAVVHVSRVEDGYQVLKNNADGLVHIWDDAPITEERLQELSKNKDFFVIPTLLTITKIKRLYIKKTEDEFKTFDKFLINEVKRLYNAGITILAGTDPPNANINYGTDLFKELELLSQASLPNIEILKAATANTADRFGLENIGYIKEGFKADLVLLDKNPIEDIKHISSINTVWKAGQKVQLK
ncbi:amidohydrolase family protein [Aquimarina rhabdastrellae]